MVCKLRFRQVCRGEVLRIPEGEVMTLHTGQPAGTKRTTPSRLAPVEFCKFLRGILSSKVALDALLGMKPIEIWVKRIARKGVVHKYVISGSSDLARSIHSTPNILEEHHIITKYPLVI